MDNKQYLSIQEAAKILKVSTKTLRRWEGRGILVPQRSAGNHRRYTKSQIQSFWKENNKAKTPSSKTPNPYKFQPPVFIPVQTGKKETKETEDFQVPQKTPTSKKKIILTSALASLALLAFLSSILALGYTKSYLGGNEKALDKSGVLKGDVLGHRIGISNYKFVVNIPSTFTDDVNFLHGITVTGISTTSGGIDTQNSDVNAGTGSVFASNLIYGLVAGNGIAIGAGQTPTVTNTGVLSIGGQTGAVTLTAGTGISISGNTPDLMTNLNLRRVQESAFQQIQQIRL